MESAQLLTRRSRDVLSRAWAGVLLKVSESQLAGSATSFHGSLLREKGLNQGPRSWSRLLHAVLTSSSGLCRAQFFSSLQDRRVLGPSLTLYMIASS